jgi:hypothetical protein
VLQLESASFSIGSMDQQLAGLKGLNSAGH